MKPIRHPETRKGIERRKKGERTHPQNHTFSVLVQVNYPLMTFLFYNNL